MLIWNYFYVLPSGFVCWFSAFCGYFYCISFLCSYNDNFSFCFEGFQKSQKITTSGVQGRAGHSSTFLCCNLCNMMGGRDTIVVIIIIVIIAFICFPCISFSYTYIYLSFALFFITERVDGGWLYRDQIPTCQMISIQKLQPGGH